VIHGPEDVTAVEQPAEGFGGSIDRVDHRGDVAHDDVSSCLPFLYGEGLNGDMARASGGFVLIDHRDGGLVVFVDGSWVMLCVPELGQNGVQAKGNLGGVDGCKKLGFGGAGSACVLALGLQCHCATSKHEGETGDGAASVEVSGMRSVNKPDELERGM
jgi:hypothetical protein